jgi:hypothetical protein
MRLLLRPYGSDGLQILKPVIRYNTIQNAVTGILIEHTEAYDTFEPTIVQNVFSGLSGYVINNTTTRGMVAEANYWGSSPAEWDAGPQTGDVNGVVKTAEHLTSAAAPVLTRLSPGTAVTIGKQKVNCVRGNGRYPTNREGTAVTIASKK